MYENFSVVKMEKQHIDDVFSIYCQNFVEKWSKKSIEQELNHNICRTFVLLHHQKVIGFVNVRHIFDEGDIANIAILNEYRKKGLGLFLMNELIKNAKEENIKKYMLEVRKSNKTAISFYEKIGFKKVGERKDYYNNPTENAYLYDLEL